MTKKHTFAARTLLLILSLPLAAFAQAHPLTAGEEPIDPAPPKGKTVEQVIQAFAAKEKEFRQARDSYVFKQSVKVQTLDSGAVDGEYQLVTDIVFDDKGKRIEKVLFAPQSTLQRISMSKEDLDDINNRYPFVLTTDELPEYNVTYVGHQKVDELDTYVFDVAPKAIEKNRRYFDGRIWVDDRDLQIVKTYGKTVPDIRGKKGQNENLFPKFTTYREQIDGKYWFPTYTRADDTLKFSSGDVDIRIIVKYTDYQRFGTETQIKIVGDPTLGGQTVEKGKQP